MEYCAVRGPFNPLLDSHTQRFDVHKDVTRGLTIAALHDGYVGNDREGTGPAHKLFLVRAKFLVTYILEELGTKPLLPEDIKAALEAAFQRVDEQVKRLAKEEDFHGRAVFLATKFNSVVVIVHDGWVYTAGDTDAYVFLARRSEPFYLTSPPHRVRRSQAMGREQVPNYGSDEPILFYFHQERVQHTDEYLVIGSENIWQYVRETDDMLPILQSRIDVEGLKEACKSIVGPFKDISKILIVITLQEHAHKPKGCGKRLRLDESKLKELLDTGWTDVLNDDNPEGFVSSDPLRFLLPYVNGRKQDPLPQTSTEYFVFHCIQEPCAEDEIEISSSL